MKNYIRITSAISIFASLTCFAANTYAIDGRDGKNVAAIGANIGLSGIGIEGRAPITEQLFGRLGVNYFTYSHEMGNSLLNYQTKLTLLTVPLMLDYHPYDSSGFRLSCGLAYNGNKLTATAKTDKSLTLYGHTYSSQDLGTVTAELTLGNKIAPILSIGYDSSFITDGPWSFNAEFGVMYSGSPKLKISTTGIVSDVATLYKKQGMEDINRDANKGLSKVKSYLKFFPILSLGFKYSL